MTEISRIASAIAHLIRFRERIEEAEYEARRQRSRIASEIAHVVANRAGDRTVTIPPGVCPTIVLSRAGEDALARKDALEASALAVEPETVGDALVLAALAYAILDSFDGDEALLESERRRVAHLMGAVVRGLENHCELTPDIETIVSHYAGTTRESWAAIEAEAERVASAVLENRQTAPAGNAPVVRTTPTREVSAREVADEVAAIPGGMT